MRLSEKEIALNESFKTLLSEESPDVEKAKSKLQGIPRLKVNIGPQHRAIRLEDQSQFETLLRRNRYAWLISDWGLGKETFIGCVFERLKGQSSYLDIYNLQCEDITTAEQLLSAFDDQFRLPLQEFVAINTAIPCSILILDNITPELSESTFEEGKGNVIEQLISSILDYCPGIYIILVSRQITKQILDFVELKPLDLPEVRNYMAVHPEANMELQDAESVEQLSRLSGGLPMHLDRIIKSLKIISFSELLDIELETGQEQRIDAEPVPKALVQAVSSLAQSNDRYSRRSYRLLKLLTVLSNGETLATIKRFYPTEPFFPGNVMELSELSLLEIVPLLSPAQKPLY